MEEYTLKKTMCEKYLIRAGRCGWAVFTIDDTGMFNCQSDYGNYNCSWLNHGRKTFKHFILELARDPYYFLGKVSKDDFFYQQKTKDNWHKQILEDRKEDNLTKEQARELWDGINEAELYDGTVATMWVYENTIMHDVYPEPWFIFEPVLDYSPMAEMFVKEIMPIFAEIIKKELEEAKLL